MTTSKKSSDQAKPLIAVIGASGHQGGGVVRALQDRGEFRVRALTRDPVKHEGLADEVVAADLNFPETLHEAFEGVHGVFAVTNFWEPGGIDEIAQGKAAISAAKRAGVEHFIWSTLPNVQQISGGKYDVPHFTDKALVDAAVASAGFRYHTFVIAPSFYQNLLGQGAPSPQRDGSLGWTLPLRATTRVHMGDVSELGRIVAGAFQNPKAAGQGQYLPHVGDVLSYSDIVATLNKQGHALTFTSVPGNVFAEFFPGARELAQMFGFIDEFGYLGRSLGDDSIALASKISGTAPTDFATWARTNIPAKVTAY